ncbi:hypothetical protein WA158_007914 [Blastocystis sp. Blastoise]
MAKKQQVDIRNSQAIEFPSELFKFLNLKESNTIQLLETKLGESKTIYDQLEVLGTLKQQMILISMKNKEIFEEKCKEVLLYIMNNNYHDPLFSIPSLDNNYDPKVSIFDSILDVDAIASIYYQLLITDTLYISNLLHYIYTYIEDTYSQYLNKQNKVSPNTQSIPVNIDTQNVFSLYKSLYTILKQESIYSYIEHIYNNEYIKSLLSNIQKWNSILFTVNNINSDYVNTLCSISLYITSFSFSCYPLSASLPPHTSLYLQSILQNQLDNLPIDNTDGTNAIASSILIYIKSLLLSHSITILKATLSNDKNLLEDYIYPYIYNNLSNTNYEIRLLAYQVLSSYISLYMRFSCCLSHSVYISILQNISVSWEIEDKRIYKCITTIFTDIITLLYANNESPESISSLLHDLFLSLSTTKSFFVTLLCVLQQQPQAIYSLLSSDIHYIKQILTGYISDKNVNTLCTKLLSLIVTTTFNDYKNNKITYDFYKSIWVPQFVQSLLNPNDIQRSKILMYALPAVLDVDYSVAELLLNELNQAENITDPKEIKSTIRPIYHYKETESLIPTTSHSIYIHILITILTLCKQKGYIQPNNQEYIVKPQEQHSLLCITTNIILDIMMSNNIPMKIALFNLLTTSLSTTTAPTATECRYILLFIKNALREIDNQYISDINKAYCSFITRIYTSIGVLFKQVKSISYKYVHDKSTFTSISSFESLLPYIQNATEPLVTSSINTYRNLLSFIKNTIQYIFSLLSPTTPASSVTIHIYILQAIATTFPYNSAYSPLLDLYTSDHFSLLLLLLNFTSTTIQSLSVSILQQFIPLLETLTRDYLEHILQWALEYSKSCLPNPIEISGSLLALIQSSSLLCESANEMLPQLETQLSGDIYIDKTLFQLDDSNLSSLHRYIRTIIYITFSRVMSPLPANGLPLTPTVQGLIKSLILLLPSLSNEMLNSRGDQASYAYTYRLILSLYIHAYKQCRYVIADETIVLADGDNDENHGNDEYNTEENDDFHGNENTSIFAEGMEVMIEGDLFAGIDDSRYDADNRGNNELKLDCRGHMIVRKEDVTSTVVQHLVQSSWLECKYIHSLLSVYVQTIPMASSPAGIEGFMTCSLMRHIGNTIILGMLSVKHLGAVQYMSRCLEDVSRACFQKGKTNNDLLTLPYQWLDSLITGSIYNNEVYILRRSSGCIQAILAILRSCPAVPAKELYPRILCRLLSICIEVNEDIYNYISIDDIPKRETSVYSRIQHIHSLNTLRLLFMDSSIYSYLYKYIEISFIVACEGLQHQNYSIRNSSLMVYTSILKRLLGVLYINKKEKKEGITAGEFFTKYPTIYTYIVKKLQHMSDKDQSNYPLLLLLSRFQPPLSSSEKQESISNTLLPLLSASSASPSLHIRESTAISICSLLPLSSLLTYIQCCINSLSIPTGMKYSYNYNYIHGIMLQIENGLYILNNNKEVLYSRENLSSNIEAYNHIYAFIASSSSFILSIKSPYIYISWIHAITYLYSISNYINSLSSSSSSLSFTILLEHIQLLIQKVATDPHGNLYPNIYKSFTLSSLQDSSLFTAIHIPPNEMNQKVHVQADAEREGFTTYLTLLLTLYVDILLHNRDYLNGNAESVCSTIHSLLNTNIYIVKYIVWKVIRQLFSLNNRGEPEELNSYISLYIVRLVYMDIIMYSSDFIKYKYMQLKCLCFVSRYLTCYPPIEFINSLMHDIHKWNNIKVTCWTLRYCSLFIGHNIDKLTYDPHFLVLLELFKSEVMNIYKYNYNLRYRSTAIDCIYTSQLLTNISRFPSINIPLCFLCIYMTEDEDCDLREYVNIVLNEVFKKYSTVMYILNQRYTSDYYAANFYVNLMASYIHVLENFNEDICIQSCSSLIQRIYNDISLSKAVIDKEALYEEEEENTYINRTQLVSLLLPSILYEIKNNPSNSSLKEFFEFYNSIYTYINSIKKADESLYHAYDYSWNKYISFALSIINQVKPLYSM